jgi:MoaA/NifB/PqqE/SkfB family radical SAM enzyme
LRKGLVSFLRLPDFALWNRIDAKRIPLSFELEVTARCSNNCRHCYINLPQDDPTALREELTPAEISDLADQAVSLGSLWCLITGGEPLIREDFRDLYRMLKKKGLLVSVFTNACLITARHIKLFREYPPRDIEITVYGATQETYERVTRIPGSYAAFRRGLALLREGEIKVDLKAMALRSNAPEFPAIARFCRERTKVPFRFDPILQLRFDENAERNAEIRAERLSAEEIIAIEAADPKRAAALKKRCATTETMPPAQELTDRLFQCGAGGGSFTVSYNGLFRLCPSLWQQDCLYDLRRGTLAEAWFDFTPRVLAMTSANPGYLEKCRICPLMNQCQWCPAQAHLECGRMDEWCEYFCRVAHARAERFGKRESMVPLRI